MKLKSNYAPCSVLSHKHQAQYTRITELDELRWPLLQFPISCAIGFTAPLAKLGKIDQK